jgi:hypothetical protein
MSENETEIHILKCLQLIERKLGGGESADWSNYDFSKLSDEVHNRTQVRLSVTTLKRIWGRLKYESAPTITTLNTLAQFADYDDWRSFCQQESLAETKKLIPIDDAKPPTRKLNQYWFLVVVPIFMMAYFFIFSNQKPTLDPDNFKFQADKMITEGVPNSVVFHYVASAANTDSIFIVQTWDIRRKKLVSKNNQEHSAIYYYPGFFRTRLIADGEVVKRHDLWITSDGWLALKEDEPIPFYFKKEEYQFNDRVEVNEDVLKKYNSPLHPTPPRIRFFNQGDLGDIMSDNFIFETTLKSEFDEGTGACQYVEVLIQCKDDIIIIPLAAKTCVGNIGLYFCGASAQSEDDDLSKFGCDLNQWTKLRVETIDKHATIFVNEEEAYSMTFPNTPTGVVGVQYRFNGVGAVKDTRFEFGGSVVKL